MRHIDWQNRLTDYINDIRDLPFAFSEHNCLFMAFGAIKAVNELDLMPLYVDRATNEIAGARALREVDGVATCQDCLLKHLGGELQPIAFARPGDIVFITEEHDNYKLIEDMRLFGPVPGICYGVNSFFLSEDGLFEIPTMKANEALWVS